MREQIPDDFYWSVMRVLQDNGHPRKRAREIYLELHDGIRRLLVDGQLHIQGLLTVTVKVQHQHTVNGWSGDRSVTTKPVARAGARIRPSLRAELEKLHDHQ